MPAHLSLHTRPARNPSLREYSARGLRIALVGASKVGKKHVFQKLDAMRTPTHGLRLYVHDSIPRHDFSQHLDELKRLISVTHDLPNPCDHVYVIWYFASDQWEPVDSTFVAELSTLCEVIVVIAKGDLRSLRVNPTTGRTEAEELEDVIAQQFRDIRIVHCSDPTLNSAQKGALSPAGYDQLLEESLVLIPKLHKRAVRRVEEARRRERLKLWLKIAISVALLAAAAVKIGTFIFPSPPKLNLAGHDIPLQHDNSLTADRPLTPDTPLEGGNPLAADNPMSPDNPSEVHNPVEPDKHMKGGRRK